MPAAPGQAWQYALVTLAVAGSALATAAHLSPRLRAWLRKWAARGLMQRRLPTPLRRLGGRLAVTRPRACGQGRGCA
ncbi:DUF6587 family protein, partial [Achromobacter pulmonis]|uniref:DUF6587 family protein n=2 Tax=Alcaligenaceae TaxID=506 RepID=UPI003C78D90D